MIHMLPTATTGSMPALRDFIGQNCPRCAQDILQQAPSNNRMPTEHAWCPSCKATLGLDELASHPRKISLMRRLFGTPQRS